MCDTVYVCIAVCVVRVFHACVRRYLSCALGCGCMCTARALAREEAKNASRKWPSGVKSWQTRCQHRSSCSRYRAHTGYPGGVGEGGRGSSRAPDSWAPFTSPAPPQTHHKLREATHRMTAEYMNERVQVSGLGRDCAACCCRRGETGGGFVD